MKQIEVYFVVYNDMRYDIAAVALFFANLHLCSGVASVLYFLFFGNTMR